jgi:hypothetical protein
VTYAVGSAGTLGFVSPDLLGVVEPHPPVRASIDAGVLPALAVLAVGRQAFQDVPTRGTTACVMLPVSWRRAAAGVLLQSAAVPFGIVPLAFALAAFIPPTAAPCGP